MSASTYTQEIGDAICEWISQGVTEVDGKFIPCTLRAWCRQPGRPSFQTVYRWMREFPEFAAAMEVARHVGADGIADDMLRIADTPVEGTRTESEDAGGEKGKVVTRTVTEDMLGHRRLQIYTREKLLAKWHPKRYGERTTLAGDPDAPLGTGVMVVPAAMNEEAWSQQLSAQQKSLAQREERASSSGGATS